MANICFMPSFVDLPVKSISHTLSFLSSDNVSIKQTSNISDSRFSFSLFPRKFFFSNNFLSSIGFLRKTKANVTCFFGTTDAA